MSRKVFISFLGIIKYINARYYFEKEGKENAGEPECFVQVSLLKMLKDIFGENDKAYIFLTSVAENKNWIDKKPDNKANFDKGLETRIKQLQKVGTIKCEVEPVHAIPEGITSEEIWQLFQTVLKKIERNDEVYIDITYAFRHIPMLALTIMNFAIATKSIQLKAIYYGAFDKILNDYEQKNGEKIFSNQVEEKIKEEDRYAPILNLSTLEQLQQWSFAARSFHETGNTFFISKLTKDETKELLVAKKGDHAEARDLTIVSNSLTSVSGNITTCRGKKIEAKDALNRAVDKVKALQLEGSFAKPFQELLESILDKLSQLTAEEYPPWFNAVKWCRQHRLIQQGITMLQEGIITEVIRLYNNPEKLQPNIRNHRDIVGVALSIRTKPQNEWDEKALKNKKFIEEINQVNKAGVLSSIYNSISTKRNYINHAGYLNEDNTEPDDFEKALKKCIDRLEQEYFNQSG